MANFTVRVELLGSPDRTTYANLASAMARIGFNDKLTDNGITYEIPPAEYIGTKNLTPLQVRDEVKNIVPAVWKDFRVFVTHTTSRWEYYNLKKLS
jgi:hypothetical protein